MRQQMDAIKAQIILVCISVFVVVDILNLINNINSINLNLFDFLIAI